MQEFCPEYGLDVLTNIKPQIQNIPYASTDGGMSGQLSNFSEFQDIGFNFDSPINAPISLIPDHQKAVLMEEIVNLIPTQSKNKIIKVTLQKPNDLNSINIYDNFRSSIIIEPNFNTYPTDNLYLTPFPSSQDHDGDNISDIQRQIDEQVKNSILPALYNYIYINRNYF